MSLRALLEFCMTHVSLDLQDSVIQKFVLALAADPSGSVLEVNGQSIACFMPTVNSTNGSPETEWTDAENERRVALIQKKYANGISPVEHAELAILQHAMLRFRQKIAPLPLDDARKLHQELLARVASQAIPK